MSFVRRHPLVSYCIIAYGLSWAYWIPLALSGARVYPGSTPTHFPGLLGPGVAAFIVTLITEGKTGVRRLAQRLILISSPRWRFWVFALSPLAFLALAVALGFVIDSPLPSMREYGLYSGLPALGLPSVFILVLLFNGFGEETGWRGFAQKRLQDRFGRIGGVLILSLIWAGWHGPSFFFIDTYRSMTLPMIIGGFGLGLCAGALVLAEVSEKTNGSVLSVALWHAIYNLTSATAASRGLIAAVTTTCVMVWAVLVLLRSVPLLRRRFAHS